jgi:hypothetical protein
VYNAFLVDRHRAAVLSFFDYWVPRLLGLRVSALGDSVFLPAKSGPVAVTSSWDQLAPGFALAFGLGVLLVVFLGTRREKRQRAALGAVLLMLGYLVVRRLLLVFLSLDLDRQVLFTNPSVTVLSFVPLFFLLGLFIHVDPQLLGSRLKGALTSCLSRRTLGALLLISFSIALGSLALYLAPAGSGIAKSLRFDEAHGDWESTLRPMRTDWYGKDSVYNYASLSQWLSYYYDVDAIEEPLSEATLDGCDILVIKIPSKPYSESEVQAITQHVRRGGGLFVIGDHTNVFGSTTALNSVLAPFHLALRDDATYDLATGHLTRYSPPRLSPDPIMWRVDQFEFMTSCSIVAPWWAWRFIPGTALIASRADYSTRDFFPELPFTLRSTFGVFLQSVGVPFGRGRVVLFADSTCFSNFSVQMDGYPSYLLGVLDFLGHGNSRIPVRPVAGALAAGCGLILFLTSLLRRTFPSILSVVAGVGIGWVAFSVAATVVHHEGYALPEATPAIPYVFFDASIAEVKIDAQHSTDQTADWTKEFQTFFVWTQRVDRVPRVVTGLDDRLDPASPLVVINPRAATSETALASLRRHVAERGAPLLLLESGLRDHTGLEKLLRALGLGLSATETGDLILEGGETFYRPVDPTIPLTYSVAPIGRGKIVLVSDATWLSDAKLGGTFTAPSDFQRKLYDFEFQLLEETLREGTPQTASLAPLRLQRGS